MQALNDIVIDWLGMWWILKVDVIAFTAVGLMIYV